MTRLRTFLTGLLTLLMAALLVLAPAGAKPASGGYQLFGGTESKLATGALDRQNGGDMLATSEAMKRYVNPVLAALTSGGDVGQYGTNLGIQSSQLANNYLSHAENTRRINAEHALKACDDSGTCSAEQVAELTETVAYWDQVDAERDAALTGACTADRNGSACRDLVRDALIAQDRLPGDFILNAGNGYAEAPIRYGEYGAENSGDPRLDAVAARERAHIVEYNSTENVLAPYEDIARSIARDQGLALIIGGGMTLAVPGGGGSRPAGGRTVGVNNLATQIAPKIERQMSRRGWDRNSIDETIAQPQRTVTTRDTRHNPQTGARNDDPATAYINRDGSYVVRNDRTGDIVQVSDRTDPNWKSPFD